MNEAVFQYLRLEGGCTAAKMWADIERLRRLGVKREDLPADFRGFTACLMALQAEGRASKSGEQWLPEFPAVVERREVARSLF